MFTDRPRSSCRFRLRVAARLAAGSTELPGGELGSSTLAEPDPCSSRRPIVGRQPVVVVPEDRLELRREDVYYFSVFEDEQLVGEIFLHDIGADWAGGALIGYGLFEGRTGVEV
jgi:hypothetical protein